MLYVVLLHGIVAIFMVMWVRALLRARGGEIPCTRWTFSWSIVFVGVGVVVVGVVTDVLVLKALDALRSISPLVFAAWLLALSASSILFIVALVTLHTNRKAAAWLRLLPPDTLVLRRVGDSVTLKLEPGSVRVPGIVPGMGGQMFVQYLVGPPAIPLAVSFTRGAATDGAPWLERLTGLVVQGEPVKPTGFSRRSSRRDKPRSVYCRVHHVAGLIALPGAQIVLVDGDQVQDSAGEFGELSFVESPPESVGKKWASRRTYRPVYASLRRGREGWRSVAFRRQRLGRA